MKRLVWGTAGVLLAGIFAARLSGLPANVQTQTVTTPLCTHGGRIYVRLARLWRCAGTQ